MANLRTAYAGYPSAVVYEQPVPGKTEGKNALNHLIWGDWLQVKTPAGEWREVHARGVDGFMHESTFQDEQLLEVNFVDIGQGDGSLVIAPDDRRLVIDAGAGDNMYRFLRWRFGKFGKPVRFDAAVITHPDQDHYFGFQPLFEEPNVSFGAVYHNGIVERVSASASDKLGPRWRDPATRQVYLENVVADLPALRRILDDPALIQGRQYPTMLKTAADSGRVGDIRMLSVEDGFLPGFGPGGAVQIQALAPVPERRADGTRLLRWFDDVGKTKNGHSVVLRLLYRDVTIFLGGDLNIPAEDYLLTHYTGLPMPPRTAVEEEELIAAARQVFGADVAKSCHHGSADFREVFLRAINAAVTVISSGDDEAHSHPRADTLGAIGRYSRGARPLVFNTELARSAKELVKNPQTLRDKIKELQKAIDQAATPAKKARAQQDFDEEVDRLERSIAVYGMISLRTDGRKVLLAQKLEKPRGNDSKWDLYQLEPGPDGRLRYQSKHAH